MSKRGYDRPLDHQEYIKMKYLSSNDDSKRNKRKRNKTLKSSEKMKQIRIYDDDIDMKKVKIGGSGDDDADEMYYGTQEEKPVIAAVIDERPNYLKRKDADTKRWKPVGDEGDVHIKEIKNIPRVKEEASGKKAKTIYRDKKTGKVRDMEAEMAVEARVAEKKSKEAEEQAAKYKEWGIGLVQRQEQKEKLESDLYEMSKPLARYKDDEDLDKLLREKEQHDDPMLEYIRSKKSKNRATDTGEELKPVYKGPVPMSNRFGIFPGYRWDGVDRSNGFEARIVQKESNRTASLEENYRWSTEDM